MKERAAKIWETDVAQRRVFVTGVFKSGERQMTFKELAGRLGRDGRTADRRAVR